MQHDRDKTLLDHLGDGDDGAFWTIWQNYRRQLYQVCLRQMSGVQADADDAQSRSMMVAHDRLPQYAQGIENLEAWLTRLTCNVCLDIHRERKRCTRGAVAVEETVDTSEEPHESAARNPEEEALQQEACRTIATAIESLPPLLRTAARLRFVEELEYDVIAERLEISAPNVRKRIQQARDLLSLSLNHERVRRGQAVPR